MFRLIARILFPRDTTWHLDSVAYLERDRHNRSMDPNYWNEFHIDRSSAGNLQEHPAPWKPSTPWERRNANRFHGHIPKSVVEHARVTEAWAKDPGHA